MGIVAHIIIACGFTRSISSTKKQTCFEILQAFYKPIRASNESNPSPQAELSSCSAVHERLVERILHFVNYYHL